MRPVAGKHVVIGLGGIGSWLLRLLAAFLYAEERRPTVLAVDGDAFESRNLARMSFARLGPKAIVLCEELSALYGDRVELVPVPRFVDAAFASRLIARSDVVFCQPDDHATRALVLRRCARLSDVAAFLGGNEGADEPSAGTIGCALAYVREAGRDATTHPGRVHPELARARGPMRRRFGGCGARTPSAPQLLFTNAAVATAQLGAYHAWRCGRLRHDEAFLDLHAGRMVPIARPNRSDPAATSLRTGRKRDSATAIR